MESYSSDTYSWPDIHRKFMHHKSIDVIDGLLRPQIRTEYLEFCKNVKSIDKSVSGKSISEITEYTKHYPKSVELNTIVQIDRDPFEILGIKEKTLIQKMSEKHVNNIINFGAYMYECSCGAGKTLAGIYYIYKLKCKTLIVSSRNSINDQWNNILTKLYPRLNIQTREDKLDANADIYIFSPQYLSNKINDKCSKLDFLKPSLIIYDEIHSLVSEKFSNVLYLPFMNVLCGKYKELPLMIALSATLPLKKTKERIMLETIFGKCYNPKSIITSISVNIWDYH